MSAVSFLQAHKPDPGLAATAGYFNPGALSVELHADPVGAPFDEMVAALGVLLHERTHWLQHVGTCAGLYSAYLAALQGALYLPHPQEIEDLALADLPLMGSARYSPDRSQFWLACEAAFVTVFGGTRAYFEGLQSRGALLALRAVERQVVEIASEVCDGDPDYDTLQKHLTPAHARKDSPVMLLSYADVGLGARHLMETVARINEIFRIADYQAARGEPITAAPFMSPPWSYARDLFFEILGRTPTAGLEAALCVLADWALMCPLPPLAPFEDLSSVSLPGPVFVKLVEALAVDDIDEVLELGTDAAGRFSRRIYDQVSQRCGMPTPPTLAALLRRAFTSVEQLRVPDDLYSVEPGDYPRQRHNSSRLRYVTKLARDAATLRIEHPGFFALPVLTYIESRRRFHELYDPIQPPLWSVGARDGFRRSMIPTGSSTSTSAPFSTRWPSAARGCPRTCSSSDYTGITPRASLRTTSWTGS